MSKETETKDETEQEVKPGQTKEVSEQRGDVQSDPAPAQPPKQPKAPKAAKVVEEDKPFTLPSAQVEIQKDAVMGVVVRVFEHEIAILEEIHGVDRIVVREDTVREDVFEATAEEEYSRLETRFGRTGQEALHKVYGSPAALAAATGLSVTVGRKVGLRRNASADTIQSSQRGQQLE